MAYKPYMKIISYIKFKNNHLYFIPYWVKNNTKKIILQFQQRGTFCTRFPFYFHSYLTLSFFHLRLCHMTLRQIVTWVYVLSCVHHGMIKFKVRCWGEEFIIIKVLIIDQSLSFLSIWIFGICDDLIWLREYNL